MHEPGEHGQIVGAVRHRVAVEAQQLGRGLDRMGDQSAHDRLRGVQPVGERRGDAEVPAAAPQRPEEIGVRRRVDLEYVAFRRDELDREQIVCGESVLGHQPAEAAAEGVARDPRAGDRASGHRQPVLGGGAVQLRPDHAALDRGGSPLGVDRDPLHLGEVDHHPAVRHGAAGHVVAAAADRDLESGPARERERRCDVARRPAADDESRSAVDEAVVNGTGRVVAGVVRCEDGSGDLSGQVGDEGGVQGCAHQMLLQVGGRVSRGRLSDLVCLG